MAKRNWNKYYIEIANLIASNSKDRSTKVGCVVVSKFNTIISTGYNGFPRSVNDDVEERHQRPLKYFVTEHAERNAIYSAARAGVSLNEATIYISGKGWPCSDCARGIIQSGISKVVTMEGKFEGKGDWEENCKVAELMLKEAGVKLVGLSDDFTEIVHV